MPITLYPKCWRGRDDCEPIHCIDAEPDGLTEEQILKLDYEPLSFICSGVAKDPELERDQYRLCFKNGCTDEISDNDIQDLTSLVVVIGSALNFDAIQKVNNGIVEIPAEQ